MSKGSALRKQMTELLTFLKSVPGRLCVVNDISKHFAA